MELGKILKFIVLKTTVIFLIFISTISFGQQEKLISRYKPGLLWHYNGLRPLEDSRLHKYDRFIIDVTYNDWLSNTHGNISSSWKSIGFNANVMFEKRFKKATSFSIGYGLRYGLSNVYSQHKTNILHNQIELCEKETTDLYKHKIFRENSLVLPFEFRFGKPKARAWKVNVGGYIGYGFPVQQITKFRNGDRTKMALAPNFGFRYGIHCRFGGRTMAIFTAYQLSEMFKQGEAVHPIQFGFSYSLF